MNFDNFQNEMKQWFQSKEITIQSIPIHFICCSIRNNHLIELNIIAKYINYVNQIDSLHLLINQQMTNEEKDFFGKSMIEEKEVTKRLTSYFMGIFPYHLICLTSFSTNQEQEKTILSSFLQFQQEDMKIIDVYELCCFLMNKKLEKETINSTLKHSNSLSNKCLYHQNDNCFCAKERNIVVIQNLMKDIYHNKKFGIDLLDFKLSQLNIENKDYFFCCSQYNKNEKKYEIALSKLIVTKEQIQCNEYQMKDKIQIGNIPLIYRGRDITCLQNYFEDIKEENIIDFNDFCFKYIYTFNNSITFTLPQLIIMENETIQQIMEKCCEYLSQDIWSFENGMKLKCLCCQSERNVKVMKSCSHTFCAKCLEVWEIDESGCMECNN